MHRFIPLLWLMGCVEGPPPVDAAPGTSSGGASPAVEASSGEAQTTGSSSGGPLPTPTACGNGLLDFAEQCDDGNLEDADGCNRDCVASGSRRWRRPAPEGAAFAGVAVDADDLIYTALIEPSHTTLMVIDRGASILEETTLETPAETSEVDRVVPRGFARTQEGSTAWIDRIRSEAKGEYGVRLHLYAADGTQFHEVLDAAFDAEVVAADEAFVVLTEQDPSQTLAGRSVDGAMTWERLVEAPSAGVIGAPGGQALLLTERLELLDGATGDTIWTSAWIGDEGPDTAFVATDRIVAVGPDDLPIPNRWVVEYALDGTERDRWILAELLPAPIPSMVADGGGNLLFVRGDLFKLDLQRRELWNVEAPGAYALHPLGRGDIVAASSAISLYAP